MPDRNRILLVNVRGPRPHTNFSPPIGLLYLVAYLRAAVEGVQVDVFDQKVSRLTHQAVADRAVDGGYGIVGLSTFSMVADYAECIARLVKARSPDTVVVMGGPHPSTFPEEALAEPAIDYAIRGEGEVAFAGLVRRLLLGDGGAGLPGVVYREGERTVVGPATPVVETLDDLPFPAWDAIGDLRAYWKRQGFGFMGRRRYLPLFTSRACPYRCTYCHSIFGKRHRARSPENIVAEMVELRRRYGVDEFEFLDDAFNLQEDRAIETLDRIRTTLPEARLLFANGLRADIMTGRYIDAMVRAGTYYLSVAIESASPRIQKLIRKNLNIDAAEESIRRCAEQRLYCNGYFMLGFPTETSEEMERTVAFAVRSRLHSASFFRVVPFKGTDLWESLDADTKAQLADLPVGSVSPYRYVVNLSAVEDSRFLKLHQHAFFRFYARPDRILRVLRDHPRPFQAAAAFVDLFVRLGFLEPVRVRLSGA
jgi:anaerobic magnesium-protoporphyrin IX monomethyl ester cyclase